MKQEKTETSMELKEGIMTNREMAEWFGCSLTTFTRNRPNWVKRLDDYCDYKLVRGGVIISNIRLFCYIKNKNYKIIQDNFSKYWKGGQLDTAKHVGTQIYDDFHKELNIGERTTVLYVGQERRVRYGRPFGAPGTKGDCVYIWCTKDDNGVPIYLTEDEERIKKELLKKYFGTADEKSLLVKQMIQEGQIKKSEAWEYYEEITQMDKYFKVFLDEFYNMTGHWLIRGTVINDIVWFDESERPAKETQE